MRNAFRKETKWFIWTWRNTKTFWQISISIHNGDGNISITGRMWYFLSLLIYAVQCRSFPDRREPGVLKAQFQWAEQKRQLKHCIIHFKKIILAGTMKKAKYDIFKTIVWRLHSRNLLMNFTISRSYFESKFHRLFKSCKCFLNRKTKKCSQ